MNYGFVYCLGSESLPSTYKIGMTDRAPSQRCLELSSATAAVTPFQVLMYGEVENAREAESRIHADLSSCRVNQAREFFSLSLQEIEEKLQEYATDVWVTSAGREELWRDALRMSFFHAKTADERATRLLEWAKVHGVRLCQKGGRVVMEGATRSPQFAPIQTAIIGMTTDLLRHLPHTMPESGLDRIMRSIATKKEVSE